MFGYIFIIFLSLFTWGRIAYYSLNSESLMYFFVFDERFRQYAHMLIFDGVSNPLWGHAENLGRILFFIGARFFQDNFRGYVISELVIIILLHLTFFWSIKKMTKSIVIALVSTAIFVADSVGSVENFAYFAYFIWKIPQYILVFMATSFFISFWQTRKMKDFILGFSIYAFAILLGTFAILYLPFFVIYTIIESFNRKKYILYSLPYIILGLIAINSSSFNPSHFQPIGWRNAESSPITFFITEDNLVEKIVLQLSVITIPKQIIEAIHTSNTTAQFAAGLVKLSPIVVLFYGLLFYVLSRAKKHAKLGLALFLSFISSLFINLYIDRINVYNELPTGRYYFVPYVFFSAFLGISIYNLIIISKAKYIKLLIVILTIIFIVSRVKDVQAYLYQKQSMHTVSNLIVDWVKNNKSNLKTDTTIIIPNQPLTTGGIHFLEMYYGDTLDFVEYDNVPDELDLKDYEPGKLVILRIKKLPDEVYQLQIDYN